MSHGVGAHAAPLRSDLLSAAVPPDPRLVDSLTAALAANPADVPLRLHLARLYLEAGAGPEALRHITDVLQRSPAELEALDLAAAASRLVGDGERAEQYERLAGALRGTPQAARSPSAPVQAVGESIAPPAGAAPEEPSRPIPLTVVGGRADEDAPDIERPTITLADVAGMEDVKRRLDVAFLMPMRNARLREMYGKSLRGGLLLYGPPGCGKTHIARATAGELGARFLAVGLSDILDMWMGNSEKAVHETFQSARRSAPCVLFLDEVDAIGQKRSLLRHSSFRGVVVQLLTEMDSIGSANEGLFVLAATNAPWDVDSALRRPGRFDRTILVLPPDGPARQAIVERGLADRPSESTDSAKVAARTEGYSGADLAHVCETAAEYALVDSIETGTPRPITQRDLERALTEIKPSTGPWFESARQFAMFANEGGMYDDLLAYMRKHRLV